MVKQAEPTPEQELQGQINYLQEIVRLADQEIHAGREETEEDVANRTELAKLKAEQAEAEGDEPDV